MVQGKKQLNSKPKFAEVVIGNNEAKGYSSGQVLEAIGETAREVLPSNYTYEFGGISREESKTTNNATLIFLSGEKLFDYIGEIFSYDVLRCSFDEYYRVERTFLLADS